MAKAVAGRGRQGQICEFFEGAGLLQGGLGSKSAGIFIY